MVDSIKVLCPIFDEYEISLQGDRPSILPPLVQNMKFLFVIETKKNDFIEAVHQIWVDVQWHYVHSTLPRRF